MEADGARVRLMPSLRRRISAGGLLGAQSCGSRRSFFAKLIYSPWIASATLSGKSSSALLLFTNDGLRDFALCAQRRNSFSQTGLIVPSRHRSLRLPEGAGWHYSILRCPSQHEGVAAVSGGEVPKASEGEHCQCHAFLDLTALREAGADRSY